MSQHTIARMNSERESLTRAIGTVGLAAGIINIMIGGGIFRLPALVAGSLGAAAPMAYVICAIAMALIVTCIADAGRRVTLTGGPYAYVGTTLGPYAGFISGVLLWMIGVFATAAVSSVLAASIGQLRAGVVRQGDARGGSRRRVRVLVVGQHARRDARRAAQHRDHGRQAVAAVVDRDRGRVLRARRESCRSPHGRRPATSRACRWSSSSRSRESRSALIPSGEVRDPERTVPRAIALAMVGVTVLYIALQVVAQGILGAALPQSRGAARRCRRRIARRRGRDRCCLPAPRSRCSATSAA